MTDEEVRQQVERTEAFVAAFRELIASTSVDPASPSRLPAIAGLSGWYSQCDLKHSSRP
jgi:hypothetical protein